MASQEIALFIYNLALFPVILLSVIFLMLSIINLFIGTKKERFPRLTNLPFVSVQVPAYNDPVATRCVRKCMEFDYPRDRYEIIIVDDSTDKRTRTALSGLAGRGSPQVKYVHRNNRDGYKPGALVNAMKQTRGEIIVIFDADWIPGKNFLKKIVRPFADDKVAIVQTRQGFYNHRTNLITRFAAYTLMAFHTIILPINNRMNCVFFCGTAGAIRRSALEDAGGWNPRSLTEDSELSARLLLKGYRTVYLETETPSEVPDTFESFLKQQMRWCYGNARVFMEHKWEILFGSGLSIRQRLMIVFLTLGNFIAPLVVLMTVFGLSGWFLGDPSLLSVNDVIDLASRFAFTGGFLLMGTIALYRQKRLHEFRYLVYSVFTIGLVLAVANTIAFTKALFNREMHWHCTPKAANSPAK